MCKCEEYLGPQTHSPGGLPLPDHLRSHLVAEPEETLQVPGSQPSLLPAGRHMAFPLAMGSPEPQSGRVRPVRCWQTGSPQDSPPHPLHPVDVLAKSLFSPPPKPPFQPLPFMVHHRLHSFGLWGWIQRPRPRLPASPHLLSDTSWHQSHQEQQSPPPPILGPQL